MDEGLKTAMARAEAVALDLEREEDPFKQENAEAIRTVLGATRRLRSVALGAGVPETLVDKIALDLL